ncbi:MAG: CocE/NonD family hydrolase [Cytophagales bacterium]|nr:CocE/NonD family hydrolase [Cytophagales bacterium]
MKKALAISALLFSSVFVFAQDFKKDSVYMRSQYDKVEYQIPMRDGIKLFTIVYIPKDKSKSYPILMNRTCYNASTYGEFKTYGHPTNYLVHDKYILAFQDVRGRYYERGHV